MLFSYVTLQNIFLEKKIHKNRLYINVYNCLLMTVYNAMLSEKRFSFKVKLII